MSNHLQHSHALIVLSVLAHACTRRLMGVVREAVTKCITPAIRALVKRAMRWLHEKEIVIDPRLDDGDYCEAVRKYFIGRNGEPFWDNLKDPKELTQIPHE